MAPLNFASAASGNTSNPQARPDAASEWSRRTNGATQTFRRPSLATSFSNSNTNHQREASADSQPARYVPPHRNGVMGDMRYTKEQLLDIYKAQEQEGGSRDSLTSLYVGDVNGVGNWSRREEPSQVPGTELCWDSEGSMMPLGLADMTEEEKELFSSSVNSVLKPLSAANATPREGLTLRKTSVSHNASTPGFGVYSPTAARPGARRRETSESYPFPSTNPLASPKPRDEGRTASPPASLRRRATDFKDSGDVLEPKSAIEPSDTGKSTFGNLNRVNNPMSAGVAAPTSPWSSTAQSGGFSPMGTFGNFGAGNVAGTQSDKRPGFGAGRAESRFKGLMSKDNGDDAGRMLKEKQSMGNIGSNEAASWRAGRPDVSALGDLDSEGVSGSAALGGGEEISPPRARGLQGLGTPSRQQPRDGFGFAAFGMTPEANFRGIMHDHHTPSGKGQHQPGDTMSPTNTNPYQSPAQDHTDMDDMDANSSDAQAAHLPGLGGFMNESAPTGVAQHALQGFGQIPGAPPSDRSQTSSVGPQRTFPPLSGLGALSGLGGPSAWGAAQGSIGTPIRERVGLGGFGDHTFGSSADLQSPSLAGLGPSSFYGANASAAPGAGRGSRLGSLFASSTQDQMRPMEDSKNGLIGAPHSAVMPRDEENDFSGFKADSDQQSAGESAQSQAQPGSSASNQPPTAQQKTMVMPDRMRWIYRDPQGNTQGPWSGLEMHDWYKAGFFSPELLVKKFEDLEYEPLAQLIRRIGNSREPFLVPQIGIPHGSSAQTTWTAGQLPPSGGGGGGGGGQPPFANSFPSFGTTLTAEQQNALERRKQEEQYLMARQKEHLMHQQMAQRMQYQNQFGLHPHQLQHQPSTQSLHSHPSLSNIASPSTYQPSPAQGSGQSNLPGFFDNSLGQGRSGFGSMKIGVGNLGNIGELDDSSMMDSLSLENQKQALFGAPGQRVQHDSNNHAQQVNSMLEDRAQLEREQAQYDAQQQDDSDHPMLNERLREFKELQNQESEHDSALDLVARDARRAQSKAVAQAVQQIHQQEPQSLKEQVEQAVSAQQSPAVQSPWAKIDTSLPHPFPPAPSQSPLPAPAAQRNRSNVADALHHESRSRSQTPSLDTPSASIAPWASQTTEASRGPSLKEIQEAEAKNAAKAEAIAAEARRVQLEKEALTLAQQPIQPAPGLPATSNWASANMASPVATPSAAWGAKATPAPTPSAAAKSMAQIQKEEEARKKRQNAAALAAQQAAVGTTATQIAGKRYAELASKVASAASSPTLPAVGGAWTTVTAGGKAKTPANTPAAAPAPAPAARTVSATIAPAAVPAAKKPAPIRTATSSAPTSASAMEGFKSWASNELRHDVKPGVQTEDFVNNLMAFPQEVEIISEAIHSVTTTIDSRHLAEEFLRRKKLAEKGVFDAALVGKSASPASVDPTRGAGGWSEVAKKSKEVPVKEDVSSGLFKVVAAKKKGGKR